MSRLPVWIRWLIETLPAIVLIGAVRCYQATLSPWIGRQCRYWPTCSNYFIAAVQKYGPWRGAWRGVCRVARCHPWMPGGIDYP
jgi:uncharacterized protein